MHEPRQGYPHTKYKADGHPRHQPYWRRAHHDWKIWIALLLMLSAMALYLGASDQSFLFPL